MSQDKDELRPGNFDRAWNDPPMFRYKGAEAKAKDGTASTKLNKRVAFPADGSGGQLSSSSAAESATEMKDLPPPLLSTKPLHDAGAKPMAAAMPPPPPSAAGAGAGPEPTPAPETASTARSATEVEDVVALLTSSLAASGLDERRRQDIAKRIDAMESKWRSGGLNEKVHNGVASMAKSLAEGDAPAAEKTQAALAADWPALCAPWLVGVRHLIVDAKNRSCATTKATNAVISQPLPPSE